MGYLYQGRQLCCDHCGKVGGVRKVKCPFGYCPASALCPSCRKSPEVKKKNDKEAHRAMGCEAGHLRWEARLAREKSLKEQGIHVRCAARNYTCNHFSQGGDFGVAEVVQVIFRNSSEEIGVFMLTEQYRALPLGDVLTVQDFLDKAGVEAFPVAPADFFRSDDPSLQGVIANALQALKK